MQRFLVYGRMHLVSKSQPPCVNMGGRVRKGSKGARHGKLGWGLCFGVCFEGMFLGILRKFQQEINLCVGAGLSFSRYVSRGCFAQPNFRSPHTPRPHKIANAQYGTRAQTKAILESRAAGHAWLPDLQWLRNSRFANILSGSTSD